MKKFTWLILAVSTLLASCAKEKTESIAEVQDRLLQAYISTVYNDTIHPTALGYYVLPKVAGSGVAPTEGKWIKWDETIRSLDGTVISTTIEDTAKKYNLFNYNLQTTHYIPKYSYFGDGYVFIGYLDAFKNMKEGGETRFIMPQRLLNATGNTQSSGYSSYIIDVTLREVINDPAVYEQNEVIAYHNAYYPTLDSAKNYFYVQTTYVAPDTVWDVVADTVISTKDTTSVVDGVTVKVLYVGRFLDGFVFDTNIADTAKAHNIYNSSNTYSSLSFVIGQSSVVAGFEEAVKTLKEGDKCFTFFTSPYGYSYTGSSTSSSSSSSDYYGTTTTTTATTDIQAFTPLTFEITIESIGAE